jgi:hypothetical protein
MTEEAAESTLQELLKVSHEEFEYEAKMVDHAKPEFKKYSYYQCRGMEVSKARVNRDTMSGYTDLSAVESKALGNVEGLGIRVKKESQELAKVQELVTVLRSAVGVLQKQLHMAEELHEKLAQATNLQAHATALEENLGELERFIKEIRKDVIKHENVAQTNKTKEELDICIAELETKKKAAMAHQEGSKNMIKKYKALLS